ncbi:hypothetical protein [Tenacibaculum phage Larrie]|nr:hypothetical protein [Tenacibaculum phage Larrie]
MAVGLLMMSFNCYEYVTTTVYNAVETQTNSDPSHTASMFKLDLRNPYKHSIVAVSRDLLTDFPMGTKVEIQGTYYDGIYTVEDKMNKRFKKSIDILINQNMRIGKWKNIKIQKVNKKEIKRLEVGQWIYTTYRGGVTGKSKIERVTKTMAILQNGTRLKIEYTDSNYLYLVGGNSGFLSSRYHLETPELKARLERKSYIDFIRSYMNSDKVKELSDNKLKQIEKIIKLGNKNNN